MWIIHTILFLNILSTIAGFYVCSASRAFFYFAVIESFELESLPKLLFRAFLITLSFFPTCIKIKRKTPPIFQNTFFFPSFCGSQTKPLFAIWKWLFPLLPHILKRDKNAWIISPFSWKKGELFRVGNCFYRSLRSASTVALGEKKNETIQMDVARALWLKWSLRLCYFYKWLSRWKIRVITP